MRFCELNTLTWVFYDSVSEDKPKCKFWTDVYDVIEKWRYFEKYGPTILLNMITLLIQNH